METGIYVDVLLVINYIITMLLVVCSGKMLGRNSGRRRIVIAALIGSAASLTIFLPLKGALVHILLKIAISMLIVFAAFKSYNYLQFIKSWMIFILTNFFFAGIMFGIWLFLKPSGMIYHGGIVYFDISALVLLLSTLTAYLILGIFGRITRAARIEEKICRLALFYKDRVVYLNALVDTGNSLADPFTGTPVTVCSLKDIKKLLDSKNIDYIKNEDYLKGEKTDINFTMIPYLHVGGSGMLPAFRADRVVISYKKERFTTEQTLIAVSREKIGTEDYSAVLNPDLCKV